MRTWKNSSRLLATMARNLTRSRSGFRSSRASCRTRALNSSHDSSRFRYGYVALARVARRWRGATVGRAGAPGSIAAIETVSFTWGRDGSRRASAPAAEDSTRSGSVLREVPPLAGPGVEPDAHPAAGRRVDEDLVAPAETRIEPGAERLATGGPRRITGTVGRVGTVANAFEKGRDHDDDAGRADPQP